jgi:hypothetical protein
MEMVKPGFYEVFEATDNKQRHKLIVYRHRHAIRVNRLLGLPYPDNSIREGDEPIFKLGDEEHVKQVLRECLNYKA